MLVEQAMQVSLGGREASSPGSPRIAELMALGSLRNMEGLPAFGPFGAAFALCSGNGQWINRK